MVGGDLLPSVGSIESFVALFRLEFPYVDDASFVCELLGGNMLIETSGEDRHLKMT